MKTKLYRFRMFSDVVIVIFLYENNGDVFDILIIVVTFLLRSKQFIRKIQGCSYFCLLALLSNLYCKSSV